MHRLIETWEKPNGAAVNRGARRELNELSAEPTSTKWLRRVEEFLGDHPGATIAVAVAMGVALGWMGKRK